MAPPDGEYAAASLNPIAIWAITLAVEGYGFASVAKARGLGPVRCGSP